MNDGTMVCGLALSNGDYLFVLEGNAPHEYGETQDYSVEPYCHCRVTTISERERERRNERVWKRILES